MENFNTNSLWDNNENKDNMENGELKMSVSSICRDKAGKKIAFVSFTDDVRTAEGVIPECKITKNNGFASIEVEQLEKYMKENLKELKKMAAGVNVLGAFMKDE